MSECAHAKAREVGHNHENRFKTPVLWCPECGAIQKGPAILAFWQLPTAPAVDLEELESMARQHCYLDKEFRRFKGVPEINTTDSCATSANAHALRTLANHGRFRIIRERGRNIAGYWPEHDPQRTAPGDGGKEGAE